MEGRTEKRRRRLEGKRRDKRNEGIEKEEFEGRSWGKREEGDVWRHGSIRQLKKM